MANPAMELRLEKFISSAEVISNMSDLNNETPVALRYQDPQTLQTITFVCSQVEPTKMVLPANVVWINFDRNSPYYKQALKRTSKNKGSHLQYEHSWEVLYFYTNVFDNQFYYPEDLADLDDERVGPASVDKAGIAKLNEAPLESNSPRLISEGHYTLENNRDPKEHEHAEKPATKLKTISSFVNIVNQPNPLIGMALVCDSHLTASWRKLTEADINMGV
jgi:hypothetical protein